MKRLTTLFMAVAFLFVTAACGKQPALADPLADSIRGEWVWIGDSSKKIVFQNDGDCMYLGVMVKYSLDMETKTVTLIASDSKISFTYREKGDVAFLSGEGDFVRMANYEACHAAFAAEQEVELKRKRNDYIRKMLYRFRGDKTELVMGGSYNLIPPTDENFLIHPEILEVEFCPKRVDIRSGSRNNVEEYRVYLYATVTNHTDRDIKLMTTAADAKYCVLTGLDSYVEENIPYKGLYRADNGEGFQSIQGGESVECWLELARLDYRTVEASVACYGIVTGWVVVPLSVLTPTDSVNDYLDCHYIDLAKVEFPS